VKSPDGSLHDYPLALAADVAALKARPDLDAVAVAAALAANTEFVDALAIAVAGRIPHPLTAAETEQAAFEGAQRAEDE